MMNFFATKYIEKSMLCTFLKIFLGIFFFLWQKKWCFWEIFPPFLKKKVKKISRLQLGEQLRHNSSKLARYSKESEKKFTVHSTVLQIIAISFWGSLLGKLLKRCAKEKPWLCTTYTMFLMIIWYHKRDELLSERHILHCKIWKF